MGKSHVAVGAFSYLALLPVVDQVAAVPTSVAGICAGTLCAAGASMLPDLDHPEARAASFLGPISRIGARGISFVSGGHRNGTHSMLALVAIAAGAIAGLVTLGQTAQIVTVAILMALGACVLFEPAPESVSILAACGATWALFAQGVGVEVVGLAVAIGYASHLVGDCLTPEGCPLLWPLSRRRFSVGLFKTDGMLEKGVAVVAALATFWLGYSALTTARAGEASGATSITKAIGSKAKDARGVIGKAKARAGGVAEPSARKAIDQAKDRVTKDIRGKVGG